MATTPGRPLEQGGCVIAGLFRPPARTTGRLVGALAQVLRRILAERGGGVMAAKSTEARRVLRELAEVTLHDGSSFHEERLAKRLDMPVEEVRRHRRRWPTGMVRSRPKTDHPTERGTPWPLGMVVLPKPHLTHQERDPDTCEVEEKTVGVTGTRTPKRHRLLHRACRTTMRTPGGTRQVSLPSDGWVGGGGGGWWGVWSSE